MTSHALGGLAGSRRTLVHMQQLVAGGRHGHLLKNIMLYQKSDSINRCRFTWRTILQNFTPIRFEQNLRLFWRRSPQQE